SPRERSERQLAQTTAPSSPLLSPSSSPGRSRQISVTTPASRAQKPSSSVRLLSIGSSPGAKNMTRPPTTPRSASTTGRGGRGTGGGGGGVSPSSSWSVSGRPVPNVSSASSSVGSSGGPFSRGSGREMISSGMSSTVLISRSSRRPRSGSVSSGARSGTLSAAGQGAASSSTSSSYPAMMLSQAASMSTSSARSRARYSFAVPRCSRS